MRPVPLDDAQLVDGNRRHLFLVGPAHRLAQTRAPRAALRQAEERTAATRTDLLVVFRPLCGAHLVRKPELALDDRQVAHHHQRGKRLPAAAAPRLLAAPPRILVEADA